MQFVVIVVDFC